MAKTKLSSIAKTRRYCNICDKLLRTEEVYLCETCFSSMTAGNGRGKKNGN